MAGRRVHAVVAVATAVLVAACAGQPAGSPGATASTSPVVATPTTGDPAPSAPDVADGDPNGVGRAAARATRSPSASTSNPGVAGGAASCANETLAESLARAVQAGNTVVLATGGFTGVTAAGDDEIDLPYSEVALTVTAALAGPQVSPDLSGWVFGDLTGGGPSTTGETSSLWARGGRMIAIVDTRSDWSGLPGPVIRVAPVVGDDVIFSWVGCWSSNGVPSRDFGGTVDIFDDRGLHPAEIQLQAVSLDDFTAQLPG